jgi:hypothetical protein
MGFFPLGPLVGAPCFFGKFIHLWILLEVAPRFFGKFIHLWSLLEVGPRFLASLFAPGAFLKWLLDFWKFYSPLEPS